MWDTQNLQNLFLILLNMAHITLHIIHMVVKISFHAINYEH